jgi:hypothetical protein
MISICLLRTPETDLKYDSHLCSEKTLIMTSPFGGDSAFFPKPIKQSVQARASLSPQTTHFRSTTLKDWDKLSLSPN